MAKDQGVSDIVGTAALLAVTVVTAGAAALAFASTTGDHPEVIRIDVLANATESDPGFITLKHAGGAGFARSALQIVVSGPSWAGPIHSGLNGTSTDFELGRVGRVDGLSHPLVAGDHIDVLVYLQGTGTTLVAATSFIVSGSASSAAPTLDAFIVDVLAPASGGSVAAGGTVYFAAEVSHPSGRKAIERVVVDLSDVDGSGEVLLYDDGTLGDLSASDGTYSAFIAIPAQAPLGAHAIDVYAYDLDANRNNVSASNSAISVTVTPGQNSGANGLNGANGAGGADAVNGLPGAGGSDGSIVILPGAQGPPGANGTGNGTEGSGSTPLPGIDAMSPTTGHAGTLVTLFGHHLVNVSGITLARQGATTAFTTSFAPDPNAAVGTQMIFSIPNIAEGAYVVTLTRSDQAWATAPTTFALSTPQPTITDVDPPQARAYTQVNLTGSNFTAITSVTLRSALLGNIAVPWAIIDDAHLDFVTHPGLSPGLYDVNVSNGLKWAVAPLAFEALSPLAPSGLSMSPTSAAVEAIVTITGANLETVDRIVLSSTNQTRIIEAGWYLDGGDIKLSIPVSAAPGGPWSLDYTVELTGTFGGVVVMPDRLTVTPTPPPTITTFSPTKGEPFTQVNIYGTNFVNVKSVTFGETAVYFAAVSTEQILAVTHSGLGSNNYTLNVTTGTGYAVTSVTFETLPLKLIPIYNKSIFTYVGADLTATSGTNNDPISTRLKFALVNPAWTVMGVTYNPVNFEPQSGSNPYTAMSKVCGPTNKVYLWSLDSTPLHNYLSPANELDFVYGVTVNMGTAGTVQTYIFTNDETKNFILPAGQYRMTVLDHGLPTTGFTDCS